MLAFIQNGFNMCVRERSAMGPRKESKNPRKLLRSRFGLYRTCEVYAVPGRRHTGRKLAVPPCRNIITQSQIARLPVQKLWEVAGEVGMVVPFIQGLCTSRIGLSEAHAASKSEGIIFVKS